MGKSPVPSMQLMAEENEDMQDDIEETQDDVQLDDTSEGEVQQENRVEKRIKQLSNKVKLTSKERDELAEANEKLKAERDSLKKESEFSSSFSESPHYQVAKDYKDEIKRKVSGGYSLEDAVVTVLAKEGKLNAIKATESPAGGSATNLPMKGDQKPLQDMNREEKRAEVLKAMERGDISLT